SNLTPVISEVFKAPMDVREGTGDAASLRTGLKKLAASGFQIGMVNNAARGTIQRRFLGSFNILNAFFCQ
ncbi:MAG: hypothetical protein WA992_08925, partial [Desulfobulbales bacterium]